MRALGTILIIIAAVAFGLGVYDAAMKTFYPTPGLKYVVVWPGHGPVTTAEVSSFLGGVQFDADGIMYRNIQDAQIIELLPEVKK